MKTIASALGLLALGILGPLAAPAHAGLRGAKACVDNVGGVAGRVSADQYPSTLKSVAEDIQASCRCVDSELGSLGDNLVHDGRDRVRDARHVVAGQARLTSTCASELVKAVGEYETAAAALATAQRAFDDERDDARKPDRQRELDDAKRKESEAKKKLSEECSITAKQSAELLRVWNALVSTLNEQQGIVEGRYKDAKQRYFDARAAVQAAETRLDEYEARLQAARKELAEAQKEAFRAEEEAERLTVSANALFDQWLAAGAVPSDPMQKIDIALVDSLREQWISTAAQASSARDREGEMDAKVRERIAAEGAISKDKSSYTRDVESRLRDMTGVNRDYDKAFQDWYKFYQEFPGYPNY
jgi:hypothetical protein